MKLGFRIFWSILLVSLAVLGTSAALLIQGAHADSLYREQERSVIEYEMIATSLDNALRTARSLGGEAASGFEEAVLLRFNHYYQEKSIFLSLAQDGTLLYDSNEQFAGIYPELLQQEDNLYLIAARPVGEQHYIFVSSGLPQEDYVLCYARNITALYNARTENIRMAVSFGMVLVLLVAVVAILVSRGLTRPLNRLQKSANALTEGNANPLPEGKDEIGLLARSFNQMADAVQQREHALKEQVEERQLFIDDLAHEMNTPLTSIQGYAALLEQANCTEEQKRKAAAYIQHETRRMKGMYQKLRVLSIAHEQGIEKKSVPVDEWFNEIGEQMRPILKEKGMKLTGQIRLQRVYGDRELLSVLLSNLVRNAILYSPEGGTIELCADEQEGRPTVTVTDHGIGIPPDKQLKIFEPFYRVDKSRSRQTGGTGLGLSICKRIAELHGAALSVQSVPGEGTTMLLSFLDEA